MTQPQICPACNGKGYRWDIAQAVGETIISLGIWTLVNALLPPDRLGAKQPCRCCEGEGKL
jgi:hypothetical protein